MIMPTHQMCLVQGRQHPQSAGEEKVKEKFSLYSEKFQLTSGKRIYHLKGKVNRSGTYILQQLLIKMGNIHFLASLQRLPKKTRKFIVVSESPQVSWTQGTNDIPLVAGLANMVSLCFATGPAAILDHSVVEMTSETGLLFQPIECGQTVITSQSDDEYKNTEYRIELPDGVDEHGSKMSSRCLERLPFIPPYHKMQIDLLLFSHFEDADAEQPTVDHNCISSSDFNWSHQ